MDRYGHEINSYLIVIGEREALRWVLSHERMAFPAIRAREAQQIVPGDQLLLYTTRGCFHNPTRDRGRVIGLARVTTPVAAPRTVRVVAGREFAVECAFELEQLVVRDGGVELAPLVPQLTAFPNPAAWAVRLRRALLRLSPGDAERLMHELSRSANDRSAALTSYGVSSPAAAAGSA